MDYAACYGDSPGMACWQTVVAPPMSAVDTWTDVQWANTMAGVASKSGTPYMQPVTGVIHCRSI